MCVVMCVVHSLWPARFCMISLLAGVWVVPASLALVLCIIICHFNYIPLSVQS